MSGIMMSISATSTPGVCSRIRIPSFPRSAWSTSTSWLSKTLVREKMFRMSSSTITTLEPASSGMRWTAAAASSAGFCGAGAFAVAACSRSAVNTRDQVLVLRRLFGDSRRAHPHDGAAAVHARNHVDRNVPGLGIVLQQVEQDETVDVRQAEVEGDRRWLKLARHVQRSRPGRGDHAFEAGFVRRIEQDRGECRIVLDDQHERIFPSSSRSSLTSNPVGSADGITAPLLS